ncbi:MAG: helix-turn-helix domain-containing protein [Clostridiales bacterium]|jgi:transcriptional regulator with XRE-family HTH domain|nr:helix-turn-helix domain-containing protein [Clostridiales bacterium]
MTFVEFVKHTRNSLGMSQHKFAKVIGIDYTTLNRWERERIVPSRLGRKNFFEYCRSNGIGVPPELLSGDDVQ